MSSETAPPPLALTPRQAEVLIYVAGYREEQGVAPTLEEIGRFLGVHRTTARDHVVSLTARGALATDHHGRARCIRLTEAGAHYVRGRGSS